MFKDKDKGSLEEKSFECPECEDELCLEIDDEDNLEEGVETKCPNCKKDITLYEDDLKEDEEDEEKDEKPKTQRPSKKKLPKMPSPSVTQSSQMSKEEILIVAEDYITRATELIRRAREMK